MATKGQNAHTEEEGHGKKKNRQKKNKDFFFFLQKYKACGRKEREAGSQSYRQPEEDMSQAVPLHLSPPATEPPPSFKVLQVVGNGGDPEMEGKIPSIC